MPRVSVIREAAARDEPKRHALQALIAVHRYQLDHRQYPQSLETAVREAGMQTVPGDPYSGQPLRYVVIDGTPVVYSVGSDERDDGGRFDWEYGAKRGDFLFCIGN